LNNSLVVPFASQGFYWYTSMSPPITHRFVSIVSFCFNLGYPGNNSAPEFQASGAYVFRPLTQTAQPVSANRTV
jgi:hypothetical protein